MLEIYGRIKSQQRGDPKTKEVIIMKRPLNRGQLVGEKRLQEIAENFVISNHASQKIAERNPNINIKEIILNPLIAYYNTDGTINIALNEYEYLVVSRKKHNDTYNIITYKEKSHNNIDIFTKREMAMRGRGRQVQKYHM